VLVLVFAGPQERFAPTVQTSTFASAQRNTVVAAAMLAGMFVPNAALTAGPRDSGIGLTVSSVRTRAHISDGVSACTGAIAIAESTSIAIGHARGGTGVIPTLRR